MTPKLFGIHNAVFIRVNKSINAFINKLAKT